MRSHALAALLATPLLVAQAPTEGAWHRVTPIDGDTVTIPVPLRLRGVDTPETHQPKCQAELEAGRRAKDRLTLLAAKGVRIVETGDRDAHGRRLVRLYDRQGRDLSEVLVADGLARRYDGKGARRPWCDAQGNLTP